MDYPQHLYLRGDVEQSIVVNDEAEAKKAAKRGYVPTIVPRDPAPADAPSQD